MEVRFLSGVPIFKLLDSRTDGYRTSKAGIESSNLSEGSNFRGLLVHRIGHSATNGESGVKFPGGLPIYLRCWWNWQTRGTQTPVLLGFICLGVPVQIRGGAPNFCCWLEPVDATLLKRVGEIHRGSNPRRQTKFSAACRSGPRRQSAKLLLAGSSPAQRSKFGISDSRVAQAPRKFRPPRANSTVEVAGGASRQVRPEHKRRLLLAGSKSK